MALRNRDRVGRRAWLGGALALALVPLHGCGRREPLKIGFIGGMSGRVADLGIGGRNGAQLATDVLNAQGGIEGRSVELLVRDDEQNDEVARRRFGELLDEGAWLVIGPMTSSVAVALAPLAAQRGVALLSPTSTTHELSGRNDAFVRVVADAPTGATQLARHLHARGDRRLATATDLRNRAFAQSWNGAAASRFRADGGEVVGEVSFEAASGLKFTELAQQLLASRPDCVLIAASAADSALLGQQLRRLAPALHLATSPWAGTEEFPQLGGRALDGTLVPQYFDRASRAPAYVAFVEQFRKRFGEAPGFPAVNAYDATMLGARALRAAQNPAAALAALQALRTHEGVQRRITIDAFGDCQAPVYLTELKDGGYAPVPST